MRLDRKLIEFHLTTPKTNAYVCQSTTKQHPNELEIHGDFTVVSYDTKGKKTVFKSRLLYVKNTKSNIGKVKQ